MSLDLCSVSSDSLKLDILVNSVSNIGSNTINAETANGPEPQPERSENIVSIAPSGLVINTIPIQRTVGNEIIKLSAKSLILENTLSKQNTAISPDAKPIMSAGYSPIGVVVFDNESKRKVNKQYTILTKIAFLLSVKKSVNKVASTNGRI